MYELFDHFMCAGESPSSSASDVDNLNNPGREVGSLPSSGNIVTVARSYQLVNRILQHVI